MTHRNRGADADHQGLTAAGIGVADTLSYHCHSSFDQAMAEATYRPYDWQGLTKQ